MNSFESRSVSRPRTQLLAQQRQEDVRIVDLPQRQGFAQKRQEGSPAKPQRRKEERRKAGEVKGPFAVFLPSLRLCSFAGGVFPAPYHGSMVGQSPAEAVLHFGQRKGIMAALKGTNGDFTGARPARRPAANGPTAPFPRAAPRPRSPEADRAAESPKRRCGTDSRSGSLAG
jgi:hypothetical protein